ncbi:hypothetical protein D3C86_1702230 [compost metagenome]
MVQGKVFGSISRVEPAPIMSCGTFLLFRYFCTARLAAVPTELNTASTWSCSTSLRVCSTVLGGLNASS